MRIFKSLIVLLVAIAFFSCKPKYDKQYSWAYPVAGDWLVQSYVGGVLQNGGPYEIRTFNSSMGRDSIWVDDYATKNGDGKFWSFRAQAKVDMSAKTFSTTGSTNAVTGYPIKITVANGRVIGNDSITMDITFSDDPDKLTYKLAGHREVSYNEYTQQ